MKNTINILLLISILLFRCTNENIVDESKLECEIINQTLFELAPEYPDLFPIQYPNTDSKELQKFRLDSALTQKKQQIDSQGLEIWLDNKLEIPDELFLNELTKHKEFEHNSIVGLKEKKINFYNIHSNKKIKIIPKSKMDNLPINNLGFANYSRIFFNKNRNMAMFVFELIDRTCTGGVHKYVIVKKEGEKWIIIN